MKVAVLGTGIMGAPVARNLAAAGHEVAVWNHTSAKAEGLGARVANSPAAAVRHAEAIVTLLTDGDVVEAVVREALPALGRGVLWLQMSTVGLEATAQLEGLAREHGLVFVDAPVLGTKQPAEDGQLVVLASGPAEARERCTPLFEPIARRVLWLGEAGAGSRLKLVVNNWIYALVEGVAETLRLADALDVDRQLFLDAIAGGGTDSPYAHLKGAQILAREFAPSASLAIAEKDRRLILAAASAAGQPLPLTEVVCGQFRRAIELGHGAEDMAATWFASEP
jgi:3-hydroxyisobutyrate dehydrogenase